ncbi:MAG: AraC family transcriptional regulator [Firmicutes bacterium]|nr:AraC family transcriptional regulator [Bacillota bacterium]
MKAPYYPIQIPYVLSKEFSKAICYTEDIIADLNDFVICVWKMSSRLNEPSIVTNHVIVADGCIDLVADFRYKEIGFAGMSKTKFGDKIKIPSLYIGARLKAGAFQVITGLDASVAMDNFLPLSKVYKGFNQKNFFEEDESAAKEKFIELLKNLIKDKIPNEYITLFDKLYSDLPDTTKKLYDKIGYSPKQCQRLFDKHFGLTPQMVLSVLRFQKCLSVLVGGESNPSEALEQVNYYDQAHFANDFKKHIGITPTDLIKLYK